MSGLCAIKDPDMLTEINKEMQLVIELGDQYINGSLTFDEYTEQLISLNEVLPIPPQSELRLEAF